MKGNTSFLGRLSTLASLMSWVSLRWPVFVLAFAIISPISPHVRVPNTYSCTYVGTHGFMDEDYDGPCPLIALIDTRGRGMW